MPTTLEPLMPNMTYGGARMSSGSVLGGNSKRYAMLVRCGYWKESA